ncbi:MAG: hypothetical protein K2I69_05825 [Muribaculaceae bacterium]|nr:hypothetical protein [Muribaculaceae bacterium]
MKKLLSLLLLLAPAAFGAEILDGKLDNSKIYPGTVHTFKVSVPENYKADGSAGLYLGLDGILCNAPEVLDSLAATGDIPPLVGVYLQPGLICRGDTVLRYNRSNEFDATDARFARFLETELLPEVNKMLTSKGEHINWRSGGENAMIFGLSSGGIAAFTAAWHRPDLFGRVFSGCGTFVPMRGGNELQAIVRKSEPRALRIFLQDGFSDTWNPLFGSWYEANRMLGTALDFAGYTASYDWQEGGHSVKRASEIFADVVKWLWQEKPQKGTSGNATLAPIMENSEEWLMGKPAVYTYSNEAVYPDGSLIALNEDNSNGIWQYITDSDGKRLFGQIFYWLHSYGTGSLHKGGMTFDADGMLWVATEAGIQVCDQNGRVRAILDLPAALKQAFADIPRKNHLKNSSLVISDNKLTLYTPSARYTRILNVRAAREGQRPESQGQG